MTSEEFSAPPPGPAPAHERPAPYFGPLPLEAADGDPRYRKLFDIGAERDLLGSFMIDPDKIGALRSRILPADFYREDHQALYTIMLALEDEGSPVNFTFLYDMAESMGLPYDPAYITGLLADTPTALFAEHYASIVERYAVRRSLSSLSQAINDIAYDAEIRESSHLYAAVDTAVYKRTQRKGQQESEGIGSLVEQYVEVLDKRMKGQMPLGLPCCWQGLTDYLVAFQRTDTVVVAAGSGMGKTTFALQLAYRSARWFQIPTLFFSLEMSKLQLVEKLLAMDAGIDAMRLRAGVIQEVEWPLVLESAQRLATLPIYINDRRMQTVATIRSQALQVARQINLGYIMVDNLQIMQGEDARGNRHQEISTISRGLADLAGLTNTVMIELSQVNRELLNRADKRPSLGDLRESGSIGADASVVLGLHREDYYDNMTDRPNVLEVIGLKHRHGPVDTALMYFQRGTGSIRDLGLMDDAPPAASHVTENNVLVY